MTTYNFKNPTTGEDFEVEVDVNGCYIAASWGGPAEEPDITIETELPDWLSEEEVYRAVQDMDDYPEPDERDCCGYEYEY